MNKDQIKGAAKEVAGKAQQTVGKVTGNTGQQVKGVVREAAGKVQKEIGNLREDVKDANKADEKETRSGRH
jgi:uncharacterized protein YjbJ (UPF0337 family)